MDRTLRFLLAGVLVGTGSPAAAVSQAAATFPAAGMQVVVGVPPATLRLEPAGFRTTEARVTIRPGGELLVNGSTGWQSSGFASMKVFVVTGVKPDPKTGTLAVQLERTERRLRDRVRIFVPLTDTATAMHQVLAPAADSAAVTNAVYEAVGRRLFGAVADSIPPPIRRRILEVADSMLAGAAITLDSIDGQPYLELKPYSPEDQVSVWSLTPTNQKYAKVLNNAVFPFVEMMSGSKAPLPGGFGFCTIYRYSEMSETTIGIYGPYTTEEKLSICAASIVAAEFAAGRISRQELVDRSIVRYRGKAVSVDLAD